MCTMKPNRHSQNRRTHLTGNSFATKSMPSKMKSLKRLEFHWLQFRGALKQRVPGRYLLRVLTVIGLIVVILCIRHYLNKPVFFTSSISCKSKIAQVSKILSPECPVVMSSIHLCKTHSANSLRTR